MFNPLELPAGQPQEPKMQMQTLSLPVTGDRSETLRAALAVFFVGLTLVFLTGFVQIDNVHNAAHDTRHALSFPCH